MKRWLFTSLLLIVGSVNAQEGVLEINQDCVAVGCFADDTAGFPVTITTGGSYRLTSTLDLAGVADTVDGIIIAAPATEFVDLDLGGFALDGGGNCMGTTVTSCSGGGGQRGIYVQTSSVVTRIHNGAVRGMGGAAIVLLGGASGSILEDLTITENGHPTAAIDPEMGGAARTMRMLNLRVSRNRGDGIGSFISGRVFVSDSIISGNGGDGIQVPSGLTVLDTVFYDNFGFGINSTATVALGRSSFFGNNTLSASNEFSITTLRDMGGNVCDDGACP